MNIYNITCAILIIALFSCNIEKFNDSNSADFTSQLKELSDEAYPDNPDIEVRHSDYLINEMDKIVIRKQKDSLFHLTVFPKKDSDDTIYMDNIDLLEFIPSIPEYINRDEYLSKICVINQEWNRNQVVYDIKDQNYTIGDKKISRIDIARNCLNSYLWELQFYAKEDGKNKICYHGWFDFPKALYTALFEDRNGVDFNIYKAGLEEWLSPESKFVDLSNIRKVNTEIGLLVNDLSDEMYPVQGERKKKFKEIIYPLSFVSMRSLQTDSTLFATFSPPGFYNRKDPRTTELSRFKNLDSVIYRTTQQQSIEQQLNDELELVFKSDDGMVTRFIIGGLEIANFPTLDPKDANNGQMYSMGIGNHPFYESEEEHLKNTSKQNPYFGLLTDKDYHWLDSHEIGIDGPLFHLDANGDLHLWLLSFERHALVGHYEMFFPKEDISHNSFI